MCGLQSFDSRNDAFIEEHARLRRLHLRKKAVPGGKPMPPWINLCGRVSWARCLLRI